MNQTPSDWHERFKQQAAWTEAIRGYLLGRLSLPPGARLLEVGCGTGAILRSLADQVPAARYGLDHNLDYLRLARQNAPGARLADGDALRLPYPAEAFDAVVCHFFLLWVAQPGAALAEMARVTRPGGSVVAFAEPDYGGRIDYPPALAELGRLQAQALRRQGAEPDMGRRLSGLFHAAGLREIETGVLGGQWRSAPGPAQLASEWSTLESDLEGQNPAGPLRALRQQDEAAWRSGERVLFVPTFYAAGMR